MSQIVTIKGDPVRDPRTPDPDVIAMARELLEMAEAGEIDGLVAVASTFDQATWAMRKGRVTYAQIGRLQCVALQSILDLTA